MGLQMPFKEVENFKLNKGLYNAATTCAFLAFHTGKFLKRIIYQTSVAHFSQHTEFHISHFLAWRGLDGCPQNEVEVFL